MVELSEYVADVVLPLLKLTPAQLFAVVERADAEHDWDAHDPIVRLSVADVRPGLSLIAASRVDDGTVTIDNVWVIPDEIAANAWLMHHPLELLRATLEHEKDRPKDYTIGVIGLPYDVEVGEPITEQTYDLGDLDSIDLSEYEDEGDDEDGHGNRDAGVPKPPSDA